MPPFEQILDRDEPLHLFIIARHPCVCPRAKKPPSQTSDGCESLFAEALPVSNSSSYARPTATPPTTSPSKGGRAGKYSRSRCHRRSLSELPFSRQAAKVRSFKTHGAFADWQVAEKIHVCPRSHTEKPI